MSSFSRREFLAASIASTCGVFVRAEGSPPEPLRDVAFFLVGDTHYFADKANPGRLDGRSAMTNARLVDQLNRLPGTSITVAAGGGTVITPRGVLHAGDLIDSGDKNGGDSPTMQRTEWAAYVADYGLTGKDGRLKYPVYEVHGNHDSPPGDGHAVRQIIGRNKARPGLANVSRNGLHYSWDWGPVHFVNLGIVVGPVPEVARKRRYNPLSSLEFLIADLAEQVGESGRPIVLMHHIDVARYSTPPDPAGPATSKEWDPCDVRGYHDVLRAYNVVAILYGHTHARNVFRWDGTPRRAEQGVPVFNVDNSAHFASDKQAIFYFQLCDGEMIVRELSTDDRWETAAWTPLSWTTRFPVQAG